MTLPPAPAEVVGADGMPLMGPHAGLARAFDWHRLGGPHRRGALWRRLHHKRWHFVGLATSEVYCAAAVVDVGWGTSTFAYVFDRRQGRDLASFSLLGLSGLGVQVGPHAAAPSFFRWSGGRVEIRQTAPGQWSLRVHSRRLRIEAAYGGTGETLLAVGPAQGGTIHATQKSPALALSGFAEADGRRFELDGGVASFDYSNGMLGRDTAWCWLSAHAPGIGLNLQQGYFGSAENALWLDGSIVPLAEALLDEEEGGQAWRVRTGDGLVDLRFTPEGTRRDDTQLLLASSRLRQQIGTFSGEVRAAPDSKTQRVERLAGLLEHHAARW
jgi:hypothetical protein